MSNGLFCKRGEVYLAYLEDGMGSEQGGHRPVLVIQNDVGNQYSPTTIIASLTTKSKNRIPTHVTIDNVLKSKCPNGKSTILMEQIRTVDKHRLISRVGFIEPSVWEEALRISVGL